ncbi:helix-turn-helix transcriptional regulator [Frigidibacter sp. MR17.14]|uniref:helix-turn-helix domain-containing protein n=1 Tax=Frigidibacter sp. MR17.14 TaxID=3126509 RepID=UPI003012F381
MSMRSLRNRACTQFGCRSQIRYRLSSSRVFHLSQTLRSPGYVALLEALIQARKAHGWTQRDLAARLQCVRSWVSKVECGERRLDPIELVVVARALGLDPAALIDVAARATPIGHTVT